MYRLFPLLLSLLSIAIPNTSFAAERDDQLYGLSQSLLDKWEHISDEASSDPVKNMAAIRSAIDGLAEESLRERIYAELILIDVKLSLEKSPEALVNIERIQVDAVALPEPIYTVKIFSGKGRAYHNMGQYLKALENIGKALELLESMGSETELAKVLMQRGQIYYSQEHFEEALDDFLYVYKIFKDAELTMLLGTVIASIAQVYSKTGEHLKSILYYKESLDLIDIEKQKLNASIIFFNVGIAYDRANEFDLAASYFNEALLLSLELDDKVGQAYAWRELGDLYLRQEKFSEAKDYLQKAFDIVFETKDRTMMVSIGLALAQVHAEVGSYKKAIEYLKPALTLAREYNIHSGLIAAHKTAAGVYEKNNQLRKALDHQKTYTELREKKYKEENQQSLNELKVSFDTESKESKNALLEKQNALNKSEIEKQAAQEKMLWALIALFTFIVLFVFIILWRQIQVRKRFAALALTDELTKAPNRRNVVEFARRQLDVALGTNMPVMIAILDLDRFKLVNDNYGHDVGDEILKQFYRLGSHALRNVDRLGRYGGEEWLLVMPGFPLGQTADVFQRIRSSVNSIPIKALPEDYCLTFSMGSVLSQPNDTLSSLLKKADEALYEAKEGGRDRWVMAEIKGHTSN